MESGKKTCRKVFAIIYESVKKPIEGSNV